MYEGTKLADGPLTLPQKFARLFTLNSFANFVYLGYASLILVVNYLAQPQADAAFNNSANSTGTLLSDDPSTQQDDYYYLQLDDPYTREVAKVNRLYLIAGIVHLINAFMYWLVWPLLVNPATGERWRIWDWVLIPEWLNITGASLYLYTASVYPRQQSTGPGMWLDTFTLDNHKIELTAAMVELGAACMWVAVWWATHARGPGRGITADDPEFLALVFLVSPSILYVAYNSCLIENPLNYYWSPQISSVYDSADLLYFIGAVFYAIVSFRDAGERPRPAFQRRKTKPRPISPLLTQAPRTLPRSPAARPGFFDSFYVWGWLWRRVSPTKPGLTVLSVTDELHTQQLSPTKGAVHV